MIDKLPQSSSILGLDLSLNATGYSLKTPYDWTTGTIKPSTKHELARLKEIAARVRNLALEMKPTLVVLENFAFARANQAHQLGGLGYFVRYVLWSNRVPFVLVAPPTLKKFATGKGNVQKPIVTAHVAKYWGFIGKDDNEADAYALTRLGCCLLGQEPTKGKHQSDVIDQILRSTDALAYC